MIKSTAARAPSTPATSKPRVQSAARTISILLAIAESPAGLNAKEISDRLKLSRQVTYHLIHTLRSTRIIRRNDQDRYVLGMAAAVIADGFRRQLAPPELLAPMARAAAAASGETAYASGWVDGEIVALTTARGGEHVLAAEVSHGFWEQAHARASGKLLLAMAEPGVRRDYLSRRQLTARTTNTITSSEALTAEFDRIARQGYAVDDEEFSKGLCCVAVLVDGFGGGVALAISAPADRFHPNFERYLSILHSAAASDAAPAGV